MNNNKILYNIPQKELKLEVTNIIINANNIISKLYVTHELTYIEQIDIIQDHMYYINYYYSVIGLLRIINDTKLLQETDKLFSNYFKDIYSNPLFFNIVKKIKKNIISIKNISIDNKYLIIINNLINKCENFNNKIVLKLLDNIELFEDKIYEIHSVNIPIIEIDKKYFKSSLTEIPFDIGNKIKLNRTNYYILQKRITDPLIRDNIEKKYLSNNEILYYLSKIILCRHEIALNMSKKNKIFNNYFEYIQNNNNNTEYEQSHDIKKMLYDLLDLTDNKINTELSIILSELHKDGFNNKLIIDQHDIIFYYEKLKNHTKFTPIMVLNLLEYTMKHFFNISMVKNDSNKYKLWSDNIIVYTLSYNNKYMSTVYFDIIGRPTKNFMHPMFVSLTNMYSPKKISKIPTIYDLQNSVILASFSSLTSQCLSINDISNIFREFGHIVQQFNNYLFYDNIEFKNLFPQIFEYLIYNEKILEKICFGKNKDVLLKHFIFMKKINFCISLKIRGINIVFDHVIHNIPKNILNTLYANINNKDESSNIIIKLYDNIYKSLMKNIPNINKNINGINFNIVSNELTQNAGKLYENILTEIIGFGIYKLISSGRGEELLSLLLMNKVNLKKNIDSFTRDIDYFSIFSEEFF